MPLSVMDCETNSEVALTCEYCGRYGARDFGAKKLCEDCHGTAGSCCPEFGRETESTKN